jgi:hypothetical protein
MIANGERCTLRYASDRDTENIAGNYTENIAGNHTENKESQIHTNGGTAPCAALSTRQDNVICPSFNAATCPSSFSNRRAFSC